MFKIKRKEQSVTSKKRFLFNNSNKLRGNTIKRTDRATIRILGSFPLLKRSPEGLGKGNCSRGCFCRLRLAFLNAHAIAMETLFAPLRTTI